MPRAKKRNGKHHVNGGSSPKALGPALARVGDPLVMADGRIFEPTPALSGELPPQPKMRPQDFKPTKRRSMSDLPIDDPKLMNGIVCVLMYSLLGIGNREIADALGIFIHDVQHIKKNSAYGESFDWIRDEFINVNSEMLHARIAAYGHDALTQVASVALRGKHEGNRLKASVDILDRGGVTKKEATKSGGMADALRIVVTSSGDQRTEVSVGGSSSVPQ